MTTDINELVGVGRKYADAIDKDRGLESGLTDCLRGLSDALEALAGEVDGQQATFDLMWKADQRAIKLWQEATGKDHIWPDRTRTTLWLLERAEAAEAERDRLQLANARLKAALDGTGGFFVERTPELDAMFDDPAAATDVRQSMQRWIDHHNERADKAEAEVERLAAALNEIAGFADDRPGDWAAMHARKALGDAS